MIHPKIQAALDADNSQVRMTLAEYKKMRLAYQDFELVDPEKDNTPLSFCAKSILDAKECVELLNWDGRYELFLVEKNRERPRVLIDVFENKVWKGIK